MIQSTRVVHLDLQGACPGPLLSDVIGRLSTWSLPSLYDEVHVILMETKYDERSLSPPSLVALYHDSRRRETCLAFATWNEKKHEYVFRSTTPKNAKGQRLDGLPDDYLDTVLDAIEMAKGTKVIDAADGGEAAVEPQKPDTRKLRQLYADARWQAVIDQVFEFAEIDKARFGL